MKFLFSTIFLSISSILFSQVKNEALFKNVLRELGLKENEVHLNLVVDKILPFSPEKTAFVIPKYRTNENDEFYEFDAYIIIADNTNNTILNTFYEPNAWTSDAINLSQIDIDTGLYILNEKTRAIGIRVNYEGSSRPNPYHSTELSLFIPENKKLKRVLKNFRVSTFVGEWDTNCSGQFEDANSYINIDQQKNNGFYNLIIKTKTKTIKNIPTNDDCVEKIKTSQDLIKLKFNGKEYQ